MSAGVTTGVVALLKEQAGASLTPNLAKAILQFTAIPLKDDEGKAYDLLTQGTRSRTGALLPFKKGGFIMAIKGQAPIVPVAILGARDAMRKGSYVIQPVTVRVRFGRPVETTGLTVAERDELASRVRGKVEALLAEG